MRRAIQARILRIIHIGGELSPILEEEVVLDAMRRRPQVQAFRAHRLGQIANQVTMRPHLYRSPIREAAFVHGESVMMFENGDHIFSASVFKQPSPCTWIELLGPESGNEILVAEFVLRAVGLEMMLVLGRA